MPRALTVAKYLVNLSDPDEGDLISNLKLQKLLYYAQGFALAILGRPLFDESIKAWEHGPVVPDVWHAFKEFGSSPIPPSDDIDMGEMSNEEISLLNEVFNVYGQFSAWKLRNMTHEEPPWRQTARDSTISHDVLRNYFASQLNESGKD